MGQRKAGGRKASWFVRTVPGGTVLAILVVTAGFAAAATVTILTQTAPATAAGTTAVVNGCTSLNAETPTSTITGTSGTVQYDCPGSPAAAAFTASSGTATPTFSLPSGLGTGSLSYAAYSSGSTTCTAGTTMTSGAAITFSTGGSFVYCLSYTTYPSGGITSFTITWAQP